MHHLPHAIVVQAEIPAQAEMSLAGTLLKGREGKYPFRPTVCLPVCLYAQMSAQTSGAYQFIAPGHTS